MADPWYRTVDMLPPLRAHVRVTWAGRVFEVIRAVAATKNNLDDPKDLPLFSGAK
jgi:hypothetical protein